MAGRTSKGSVTADERQQSGIPGTGGKFPVFDEKSALSAIKLRHNGKGVSSDAVITKVARWANDNNNAKVKSAVADAKAEDKG